MNRIFAPGCALMLYKEDLGEKVFSFLQNKGVNNTLNTCCKHDPAFEQHTEVINICPGCDKRFKKDYNNCSTKSLWEIIDESVDFQFPDYAGVEMTIMDACPTRESIHIHNAIRSLLNKMNIRINEPDKTGIHSTCCGDSFYGVIPVDMVKEQMVKRTGEMPVENVVVYCISCIKSVHIGGKTPWYLVDLLFGETTEAQECDPDIWHKSIDDYIALH